MIAVTAALRICVTANAISVVPMSFLFRIQAFCLPYLRESYLNASIALISIFSVAVGSLLNEDVILWK